ncbi:MAG: urea carboxylase, partial [Candidatus Azotimanducaceae bacterium]
EGPPHHGGEAGLHPSNIHDNAYAVGTVDFTGDMPVILGPDGPSLGGFVCPATIIRADLWKLGQLRPGDKIRFVPVSHADALTRWQGLSAWINDPQSHPSSGAYPAQTLPMLPPLDAVIAARQLDSGIALKFRASGDDYLLLEVGEQVLEISLRFRVHAIHLQMIEEKVPGVLEMTPGIRSLQVHYEPEICARDQLIEKLASIAHMVDETTIRKVPSRIVHLPLSFDDPACQEAIDKYQQSVRPDAPWCPSNLEFIRRINGLDAIADVEHTVFDATYLVLGLGDVYLGAPVATPLDPGHRLVTTKYNPARTWTAENSVGIGGAYLCIYGMEGPGGYQFVGRTLQMWNRYRQTADFTQPWLLRFFDQIKFYPVTHEALEAMREDFVRGRLKLEIEESHFDIDEHEKFVHAHEERTAKFVAQRQEAFAQELAAWQRDGLLQVEDAHDAVLDDQVPVDIPTGHFVVESHVSGSVWKFEAELGEQFVMGQTLLLVESMKMELEVKPDRAGTLVRYLVNPGQQIVSGQPLALFMEKEYAHVD